MAKAGDHYVVTLKKSHLEWGTHRYTGTRGDVLGEGYLPIPLDVAQRFGVVNSNGTNGGDEIGKNLFRCTSADGFFHGYLKAQGSSYAGSKYAKQFAGDGDLKALGSWFAHIGAKEGSRIRIEWISPTDIVIEAIGLKNTSAAKVLPQRDKQIVPNTSSNKSAPSKQQEKLKPKPVSVSKGDIIVHKTWGSGTVYDVTEQLLKVSFPSVGDKKFVNPDAFEKGFIQKK